MKLISIVLPVFNEEKVIELFHNDLLSTIDKIKTYNFEIIYVLDKSVDRSFELLKKICDNDQRVSVLHLSKRFGHQMSLVAGMDKCKGDAVIMMDCDLQHPPELIPELIKKYEDGFDVVNTIRIQTRGVSFFKKNSSKLFYRFLNYISKADIVQDAADFRLLSRKVLNLFKNEIREQNQFLRGLVSWIGFNQTYIKFTSKQRAGGKSKYTILQLIKFALLGIKSFSKAPLKIAITLGFLFALLSFIYGFYSIAVYIFSGESPPGWTSLIAIVTFSLGLQLLFLGIIGEYIGSVLDEVKKRPLYIVDEEYSNKEDIES